MAKKDTRIAIYATAEQKERLQQRADDAEMTLSAYCQDILSQHLQGELFADKNEELAVEQRLEELVGLARDEIEDAAEDIRQTQQKTALHTIALWELLKTDAGAAQRKEAMTDAARRLREDLVKAGIDPDALGEPATQQAKATQTDDTSTATQSDSAAETAKPADDTWKTDDDTETQADDSVSADSPAADADDEAGDEPWWKPTDDEEEEESDDDDDVYIDRDWDI
ncbi:hypothetical protein ACFR9U_14470 [Halorientalis brevis]|uniref:Ribbon-helix-helix protein, copG family n=1 Tax=Halorientalis brevis TaxID=1126241 RepID=A0ABD6CEF8_9EURY|nr:hypothetical protein [Halorientalis brevis]